MIEASMADSEWRRKVRESNRVLDGLWAVSEKFRRREAAERRRFERSVWCAHRERGWCLECALDEMDTEREVLAL